MNKTNNHNINNLEIQTFNDLHCHTTLSYCANDEMTLKNIAKKLDECEFCNKLAITDHGFAIYFPLEVVLTWKFMVDHGYLFEVYREQGNKKLAKHIKKISKLKNPHILKGIEVELMNNGELTVDEKFLEELDIVIGSVHWLPVLLETKNKDAIFEGWWKNTQQLLDHNITILGHPLRFLYNREVNPTEEQIDAVVKLAKQKNVALELNSTGKNYQQDLPLLKSILKHEAILSVSNDSHHLSTIGHFDYHENCAFMLGAKLTDFNLLKI